MYVPTSQYPKYKKFTHLNSTPPKKNQSKQTNPTNNSIKNATWIDISQKIYTYGQQIYEKVLNITIIREEQVKTSMKDHLMPMSMAIPKKRQAIRVCRDVEKRKLYTVGRNVN
jgi:hypothetical protein